MKAFAAALGLALLAAQDQQAPKPTFKSAVDLVPVDVNVIDKSGRPVPDFTLTVDGKPRRIVSAQFISVDRAVDSAPPSKPLETNPCQMVKRPGEEKQRERVLSEEEIRLVWKALDGERCLDRRAVPNSPVDRSAGRRGSRRGLVGVRTGHRVVDDSR